jgi:hypothetical protein
MIKCHPNDNKVCNFLFQVSMYYKCQILIIDISLKFIDK